MRQLHRLSLLFLFIGCSSPVAPAVDGQWGSNQAGLVITRAGGSVTLQCGTGTIDAGWTLTPDGDFSASGMTYAGGGPEPVGGRPPRPSVFTGRVSGDTFRLSIVVTATNTTIGPLVMQRNGPQISQLCL
jgi:hypothetical protein